MYLKITGGIHAAEFEVYRKDKILFDSQQKSR